jgi:Spy/CpxP family protein refolding chaperone
MKFILSALVALFCFTSFAEDKVYDIGCTIIIDVIRYDSMIGEFASPSYDGTIGTGGDGVQTMAGYDFITRRFDDVKEASYYWKHAAENLWDAYAENHSVMTNRGRQAANLGAVAYAFAYNNAAIQQKFMAKVNMLTDTLEEAAKEDINRLTKDLQEVKNSKISCSKELSKLEGSINGKISEMRAAVNETSASVKATQTELASIQLRLSQATTPEQIRNIQMEFNKKLAETEQKALDAGLTKKAREEVLRLVQVTEIAGGELPAEVASYSNQMARLNVYLGFKDEDENGEPVNNKGMFEEPMKKDGGKAKNINDYLNSYGVIAVHKEDKEGDEGGSNDTPYENTFTVKGMEVTAPFQVPKNWVDNDSITINANGRLQARIMTDLSRPWSFDPETKTFKNATVQCGSQNIIVSGTSASSPGNYYCKVTVNNGTYSATMTTDGSYNENQWCFLIGSLGYIMVENEYGVQEQVLVSEYTIGAVPVILTYH